MKSIFLMTLFNEIVGWTRVAVCQKYQVKLKMRIHFMQD